MNSATLIDDSKTKADFLTIDRWVFERQSYELFQEMKWETASVFLSDDTPEWKDIPANETTLLILRSAVISQWRQISLRLLCEMSKGLTPWQKYDQPAFYRERLISESTRSILVTLGFYWEKVLPMAFVQAVPHITAVCGVLGASPRSEKQVNTELKKISRESRTE